MTDDELIDIGAVAHDACEEGALSFPIALLRTVTSYRTQLVALAAKHHRGTLVDNIGVAWCIECETPIRSCYVEERGRFVRFATVDQELARHIDTDMRCVYRVLALRQRIRHATESSPSIVVR